MRWLADENFNNIIVRGVRRRYPAIDLVRVQDTGLAGLEDEVILECAAVERRCVLTHDVSTVIAFASSRLQRGLSMPGVFEVPRHASLNAVIEDIILIDTCTEAEEWAGLVSFLPLKSR